MLVAVLVACAALALPRVRAASTVQLEGRGRVTFDCPLKDGSDWRYDASKPHADHVEFIVASIAYFRQMCVAGWPEPMPAACATLGGHPDRVYGGYYAVIYTTTMPSAMPEGLLLHELCHTQGWVHGRHY